VETLNEAKRQGVVVVEVKEEEGGTLERLRRQTARQPGSAAVLCLREKEFIRNVNRYSSHRHVTLGRKLSRLALENDLTLAAASARFSVFIASESYCLSALWQ
jgi:hypothetical protein